MPPQNGPILQLAVIVIEWRLFALRQKLPGLCFSVPLEMSMKTYLKTNCSFTRNCLLSGLRFVTAPLLTCLAALFLSVTTPAVASGPSANPDAPRSTFVTSTPATEIERLICASQLRYI